MPSLTEAQLIRHLCGADDPDERADTRARMDEDPVLMARMPALSAALAGPTLPVQRWPLPPPGWGGLALVGEARAMGGAQGHALVFEESDDLDRLVVVLWNTGAGWEVLTPTGPEDVVRPADLPRDAAGRRVVDVVLPAGQSAWAVALPRPSEGPDWDRSEPWSRFRAALFAGALPVQVVQLGSPPR